MVEAIIAASATTTTSRLIDSGRMAMGTPAAMEITTIGMTTGIVRLTVALTKDTASPEATVIDPPV